MKRLLVAFALAITVPPGFAQTAGGVSNALRGSTALDAESRPPLLPKPVNDDVRRARSFAAQPPVIPHQIDNYQVDLRFNKCMSCHGRERVGESQAPMVSVTHFLDREGQMRQEISPRRYFCTQCHVPQTDARPPVKNTFQDFYEIKPLPAKGPGR